MLKYGTDKPDLRNPLEIVDLTEFFSDVEFKAFKGRPVRGINVPGCAKQSKGWFEKMLKYALEIGMKGLGYIEVLEDGSYKGPIDKFLPDDKKEELRSIFNFKTDDTLFFICDTPKVVNELDRMIMLLKDEENIREIIAFPMNSNAQDMLLGAPNYVTELQLRETHIKLRRPVEKDK